MLKTDARLRFLFSAAVSFIIAAALPAVRAGAEDPDPEMGGRAVIMGDLNIEENEQVLENPYSQTQAQVIEYFTHLNNLAASLGNGGAPEQLKDLSDEALRYLAAAYLYCSIKQGTCPAILDAILEVEVINSKIRNTPACPNLERFWRIWLKNDMERRHDYSGKLGYLQATTEFRQKSRPKYVKCQPTVAKETASSLSSLQDYFKSRYTSGSLARRSLEQALLVLDGISRQVQDIFRQVGMGTSGEKVPQGTGLKKKSTGGKSSGTATKKSR